MTESNTRKLNYSDAIREALEQCMEQDDKVIVIGEGVPDPKAIFGTTHGLYESFGSRRVFDMPLAENGMTGVCIGAAMTGMRPVLVHQRIDFSLLAMDQIVNNAAKWHYMFDGKANVPLVVRMIIGRGWGQGPQHSQSLQGLYAQIPGLKVIMPTTAHDAKGMLVSAIEDNNPVIFIEHRWLQHIEDDVPTDLYRVPLNQARKIHAGDQVTIAAFSFMAMEALKAAKVLKSLMGIEVEVLDMRSIRPLDTDSVIESVQRTGRLIVVDTAFDSGSVSGDLVARVTQQAFASLQSAPVRISPPEFPVPTSPYMTEEWYPGAGEIIRSVFGMLEVNVTASDGEKIDEQLDTGKPHDTPSNDFVGPF